MSETIKGPQASIDFNNEFTTLVSREIGNLVLGEWIGGGVARTVYAHQSFQDKVVKIETRGYSFQNAAEWEIWCEVKNTKLAKYFAPCFEISRAGVVLVQARTEKFPMDILPKRLPEFMTDLKPSNFGLYEKRIVCHDYGILLNGLISTVCKASRIKSIKWKAE